MKNLRLIFFNNNNSGKCVNIDLFFFFVFFYSEKLWNVRRCRNDHLPFFLQETLKLTPRTLSSPPAGWKVSKETNLSDWFGKRKWWETGWWRWTDTTWKKGSVIFTDGSTVTANIAENWAVTHAPLGRTTWSGPWRRRKLWNSSVTCLTFYS